MEAAGIPFEQRWGPVGCYLSSWIEAREEGRKLSVAAACEAAGFHLTRSVNDAGTTLTFVPPSKQLDADSPTSSPSRGHKMLCPPTRS
jgi:hypothetical protein